MEQFEFCKDKEFDLILLGRIAIDLNPLDYYKPLSESTTFRRYVGGSPANIATGLARLGKKIGFFSRVSADQFGDFALSFFKQEGIDTSCVKRCTEGEKIGLTFTEILDEHTSSILMYRNQAADLSLCVDDVSEEYIKRSKALLISGTALAGGSSRDAAFKSMLFAKRNDVKIIFDIDYRPYTWKNEDEISIYYSLVAQESDIIFGSRVEFDLMERLIQPGMSDKESADYWLGKRAHIVIIKHGKDGSVAYTRDGGCYNMKPFLVKLLKSFGGGDGYASAFLYGLLEGYPIPQCLELGSASAAMLVASAACSADMPTVEELNAFLEESKREHGEVV